MLILREDMAAPTIIDARPLLRLCDEVQVLLDEAADWLMGDESYDRDVISDSLTKSAVDLREAIRGAVA